MAQSFYGSICYTDLVEMLKTGKYQGEKAQNGKIYVNINVWINDNEDQYGNHGSIQLQPKKEIWEAEKQNPNKERTKTFFGNIKKSQKKEVTAQDFQAEDTDDDLPF